MKEVCQKFKCFTNKKVIRRSDAFWEWRSFVMLKNKVSFS